MPDDDVWTEFDSEIGADAGGDAPPAPAAAAADVNGAVLDAGRAVLTAARSLLDLAERRLEARRAPEPEPAAAGPPTGRPRVRWKPDDRRREAIELSY